MADATQGTYQLTAKIKVKKLAKSIVIKSEIDKSSTAIRILTNYANRFEQLSNLSKWSQVDLRNLRQYSDRLKQFKDEYQDLLTNSDKFLLSTSILLSKACASIILNTSGKSRLDEVKKRLIQITSNLRKISV